MSEKIILLVEDNPDDELPVVILTSSRVEQDLIEGYRLGANCYVRKPVDFAEFINATPQLGRYRQMLNEAPPKTGI